MSDKPMITEAEFMVARGAYQKEYSLREALEAFIEFRERCEREKQEEEQ